MNSLAAIDDPYQRFASGKCKMYATVCFLFFCQPERRQTPATQFQQTRNLFNSRLISRIVSRPQLLPAFCFFAQFIR